MRFAPTSEQQEFGQAIRSFLRQRAPESGLIERIADENRFDTKLWKDLSEQLELPGLMVPESHGGSGFGAIELAMTLEEFGRALTPVPYFATTVLALPLIMGADINGVADDLVRDLATGTSIGAAALAEPGRSATSIPATTATGNRLQGHKTLVVDGDLADVFVVSAQVDGVLGLYCVSADAAGVTVRRQEMLDPTRGSAEVWFDDVEATCLDTSALSVNVLNQVLDRARVALAAEQVGGAARCLEIALEHVKTREQFGRPIGSFQAVKHQCAKMLYDLEVARRAAWYAAWAIEEAPEELAMVIPTVKYLCSEAFESAARQCVHLLGGIGFTWEHPAQLFFKRATSAAQFLGSRTDALYQLADQILGDNHNDSRSS